MTPAERLAEICAGHAALEGPLLPILHAVQAEFGCVDAEAERAIAKALNLSRAEVHGVVSFYHDFAVEPDPRPVIQLCRAEACQARGVEALVSAAEAAAGLARSADDLSAFVDQRLAYEGLGPEAVALVGFSQGAMMALHVAPRRPVAMAAVVAISGQLLVPERLLAETMTRPPMLVMHGDLDEVVPFAAMAAAADALVAAGFDTYGQVMQGTGHGIAQDGLSTALAFLKQHLPG